MSTTTIPASERQEQLRPAVEAWVEEVGGWGLIRARDITRIISSRHPDLWASQPSADMALSTFLGRTGTEQNVGHNVLDALQELTDEINAADDPRSYFFGLVRNVTGLGLATMRPGTEWPFRVELVPVAKLYADDTYQRPVDDNFVRKTVLSYDESLVGTIDVAAVRGGRFAIMDGLQRYAASTLVGKEAMWCSVYDGLAVSDQARFFHHKNRDRKTVHPYYHFRARLVAGDPDAEAIDRITAAAGFKLGIAALQADTITAIRACEEVFGWKCEHRDNALEPTLTKLQRMWFDVKGGKDGSLIRGFGRFFAVYGDDEIDWPHLEEQLVKLGPLILQGRAKDLANRATASTFTIGYGIGRALVTFHNTGQPREKRLDPSRLLLASARKS